MFTRIISIALSLFLAMPLSFAQTQEFTPIWECTNRQDNAVICAPLCGAADAHLSIEERPTRVCTQADLQEGEIVALANCERNLNQNDPPSCPAPASTSQSSSDNKNRNKALIAGGVALIGVVLVKSMTPAELPGGAQIRPSANVAYRDGFAYSTAGLAVDWREWQFSAASGNDGRGWSKPYMRAKWEWVF